MTTRDSLWKNTMSAAAKASLTANRHVCGSNYIHTEKAKLLMDDAFTTSREEGIYSFLLSVLPAFIVTITMLWEH